MKTFGTGIIIIFKLYVLYLEILIIITPLQTANTHFKSRLPMLYSFKMKNFKTWLYALDCVCGRHVFISLDTICTRWSLRIDYRNVYGIQCYIKAVTCQALHYIINSPICIIQRDATSGHQWNATKYPQTFFSFSPI